MAPPAQVLSYVPKLLVPLLTGRNEDDEGNLKSNGWETIPDQTEEFLTANNVCRGVLNHAALSLALRFYLSNAADLRNSGTCSNDVYLAEYNYSEKTMLPLCSHSGLWCSVACLCWKESKASAIRRTLISFEHPWVEQHSSQAQMQVFGPPPTAHPAAVDSLQPGPSMLPQPCQLYPSPMAQQSPIVSICFNDILDNIALLLQST